jgi:hypothetical protein
LALAVSAAIPSLDLHFPDLARPASYLLLPDPFDILLFSGDFSDSDFTYACHVMQLCHRFLIRALSDSPDFQFLMAFSMLNGRSFSQSCLSRAIKISLACETKGAISRLLAHFSASDMPVFVESLFMWNISHSFDLLAGHIPAIFGHYFAAHFHEFLVPMQVLVSVYRSDPVEAAEGLYARDSVIALGNQEYLLWLIAFLRQVQIPGRFPPELVSGHARELLGHLGLVSDLIASATRMFDPLIDRLLCVAIRMLVTFFDALFAPPIAETLFWFIHKSCHYLLSVPITNRASAVTVDVENTHRVLVKTLQSKKAHFAPFVTSKPNQINTPAMALIVAEIAAPPAVTNRLVLTLLLSDDPTVFSVALLLARKQPNANLGDLLFDLIYGGVWFGRGALARVLVRFCLLLTVACASREFWSTFPAAPGFAEFCATFQEMVIGPSLAANCRPLHEAIVFFLGAFYCSYPGMPRPISLDPFFSNELDMCEDAIRLLRQDRSVRLLLTHDRGCCVAWKRRFAFQHLIEPPAWAVPLALAQQGRARRRRLSF